MGDLSLEQAIRTIKHSIKQARIPGNDWRRELDLIENVVDHLNDVIPERSVEVEPLDRKRAPQDNGPHFSSPTRWPPTMSAEQIEEAIDTLCGCSGRYDCNCVSVFKKACSDAWYAHNTKDDKT